MSNDLTTVPKDPYGAPTAINLPKEVFDRAMSAIWGNSHYKENGYHTAGTPAPVLSKVRECGCMVFEDSQKRMSAEKFQCSPARDSILFTPSDLYCPDPEFPRLPDFTKKAVGFMHTHPSERVTSFDATDVSFMLVNQLNFGLIVTGRSTVFLYLRTKATKEGKTQALNADWINENFKRTGELLNTIKDVGKWEHLSESTAAQIAQHYELAFYKGTNLVLKRLWPKPGDNAPHKHKPHAASHADTNLRH
jgi:hypothetical protein